MKSKVVEQVEEVLKGIRTAEDIAEIERIIGEVKGKILLGPVGGVWEGKKPCWEIEGTYCKLEEYGARGDDTSICQVCRVYKRWGGAGPIQIKLFGRGIDTTLRSTGRSVEQEKAQVLRAT